MSAASEFIKNKPLASYILLLVTFSIIVIVVMAIYAGNINEKIEDFPTKDYIDLRIDYKNQIQDSINMELINPKLDKIIQLLEEQNK